MIFFLKTYQVIWETLNSHGRFAPTAISNEKVSINDRS